jgi:hypothetical protein
VTAAAAAEGGRRPGLGASGMQRCCRPSGTGICRCRRRVCWWLCLAGRWAAAVGRTLPCCSGWFTCSAASLL